MEKILRHETLFGKLTSIQDASHLTKERSVTSDLKVFKVSNIIENNSLFLGFGKPNVYIGLPNKESFFKFDAKSIKRKESSIVDTRGWVQSGLIIKIENITNEIRERINNSASSFEGSRYWTCVNANGRVLNRAGFTTGGKDFSDFYLPMTMAKCILKNGIEYQGEKLEISIIKTTPNYLESFGLSVIRSQWATVYRHGKRAYKRVTKKNKFCNFLESIKHKIEDKFSSKKCKKIEDVVTNFPEDILEKNMNKMELTVTSPSNIGTWGRYIWGPHSFFEVKMDQELINTKLPETLKEYSAKKSGFFTYIKKNVLFSKPVIKFIRKHLISVKEVYKESTEKDLFNMLRTNTENKPHKYNIVITSESIHVIKIDIKYKFIDWILSKHVLLSGYSNDVRFAGEFWKEPTGEIFFNNNSGTYAPNVELTEQVKYILEELFPNIKIKDTQFNEVQN